MQAPDAPALYAVVMAGGSGTRFWPASRTRRPKQFLPISGGRPMIEETILRLEGLIPLENVLVVTAASQVDAVREALPQLSTDNILAEPCARNTAGAVAWAAHVLAERDPNSIQAVLAADHVIEPAESFRKTLAAAAAQAKNGGTLITFGVKPTHPATGYGYIEVDGQIATIQKVPVFAVSRFVEKPDKERAAEFVANKRFYWNSGMFVWQTSAIQEAFKKHAPDFAKAFKSLGKKRTLEQVYESLPSLPVDVAIMERADNVRMLPIDYGWSDVGSWSALPALSEAGPSGNWSLQGDEGLLVSVDSKGCVAYSEGKRVIALVGVEDLIVVQTEGATLVCPRDRAQDVKAIVEELREKGPDFL